MRVINRPLALILAAALVAAGVIVIAEVIAFAVHAGPVVVHWPAWYSWAAKTYWNAPVIKVWSVILLIVGAIVLTFELKPPRIARLKLRSDEKATDAAMTRKGLAGVLRAAALEVDGISGAAVKIRRRRARIMATSAARGRRAAGALREPVVTSVRRHLENLEMLRPPFLTVRVVPRSR